MVSDPVVDRGMLAEYCAGVSITTIAARYHFEDAEDVLRALERALAALDEQIKQNAADYRSP